MQKLLLVVFTVITAVVWAQEPEEELDCRELLVNSDFEGGAWGYLRYFPRRTFFPTTHRVIIQGGRARPNHTSFRSFCQPIVPGRTYTVAARVRNLTPLTPAKVKLLFVDNAWHIKSKHKKLADGDWHEIRFDCTMKPSRYNLAYVRVDSDSDIELDRLSLTEGSRKEFPPFVDGELLPCGQTLFDAGREGVFRILRRNVTGRAGETDLEVRDARGRVVGHHRFAYGSERFSEFALAVPATHPKGLFEVFVPGLTPVRYAVLEDLSGCCFSYNPHGGHYYPQHDMDLSWHHRYMPIIGGGNRAFCYSIDWPRDERYLAAVDALGLDTILTMPNFRTFSSKGECPWDETVKPDYLAQAVETAKCFRGHRILGVELFNEPFLWRIRTGAEAGRRTMRGAKVAQIHAETVPCIRAANPELKVFGPCCSLKEQSYLEDFLQAGGGAYLDGISVHTYAVDPDADDFAGLYRELRERVRRHLGRDLPVYNTEAYFGVRNSPCTMSDEEARRAYFRDNEWSHASVVAAQIVNHAAAQVSWCNFGPEFMLSGLTESDRPYPYAALAALNAAISFLGDSGAGDEIALMPGLRAFLFPRAAKGVLATLRSRVADSVGVSGVGGLEIYDMFGNRQRTESLTLKDEIIYFRFHSAEEAVSRLKSLAFSGLEGTAARERPLPVRTIRIVRSPDLSLKDASAIHLGEKDLSRLHTPGVAWRGEDDLSADVRLVWNETGIKIGVFVRDDRAVYPESVARAYDADSLQIYFDQRNDATPASEESGRRREDDIIYNIAALEDGKRSVAYVAFANGSRYLGAANETTGIDEEVEVSYSREKEHHVYEVFFPARVFPDMTLKEGAKFGFSLAINDADVKGSRGRSLVLSSPGEEPYHHAHEYPDLELVGAAVDCGETRKGKGKERR